jgi:hypothetical protein
MKAKIILGPAVNESALRKISALHPDFYVLDFTPFHRNCATEATAKEIKKALPVKTQLIGAFSKNPVQQILYLLTENIIDLAFCSNCSERDLLRIAETTKKPLIRTVDHMDSATVFRDERQTGTYLYFPKTPDLQILNDLKKPYILDVSNDDQESFNIRTENGGGPFAFWCKEADIEQTKRIIETIDSIYYERR